MKYLKQFIVGSSILVITPFLICFNQYLIEKKKKEKIGLKGKNFIDDIFLKFFNYEVNHINYFNYSFAAPLNFGLFNIYSLIIAEYFQLSYENRFMLIMIINYLYIITQSTYISRLGGIYKFNKKQWITYYIFMFILYSLTWNIVINTLEKLI